MVPADIMFLGVMCVAAQDKWSNKPPSDEESDSSSPVEDDYEEQPCNYLINLIKIDKYCLLSL